MSGSDEQNFPDDAFRAKQASNRTSGPSSPVKKPAAGVSVELIGSQGARDHGSKTRHWMSHGRAVGEFTGDDG